MCMENICDVGVDGTLRRTTAKSVNRKYVKAILWGEGGVGPYYCGLRRSYTLPAVVTSFWGPASNTYASPWRGAWIGCG